MMASPHQLSSPHRGLLVINITLINFRSSYRCLSHMPSKHLYIFTYIFPLNSNKFKHFKGCLQMILNSKFQNAAIINGGSYSKWWMLPKCFERRSLIPDVSSQNFVIPFGPPSSYVLWHNGGKSHSDYTVIFTGVVIK